MPKMLRDMNEIRSAAGQRGSGNTMWFNDSTMKAWGTRLSSIVHPTARGALFVTSDRTWDGKRAYSVRHITDEGRVSTPAKAWQSFSTLYNAHRAARRHAAKIGHPAYALTPERDVPFSA